MNRTRKTAWSVASGLLFTIVAVTAALISTPWLLHWLGSERFGAYKALTDWMGYLALLDMGIGGALMTRLALRAGQDDAPGVRGTLAAGLQLYLGVTLAMIAGGIVLVVALPHLIPLEKVSSYELRAAGLISLLPLLITPLLAFRLLAEARQRNYLNSLLMTMQSILATGVWLGAAWAGWGLVGQSLALTVAQIPTALILTWNGMRAYPGVWSAAPDPAAKKAVRALSWPTFIHSMTDRVGLIGDNVIIALILGPVAVVPFYLTQQLALLAQSQLRGLSNASWAGLVELYSQGQSAILRLRLLELTGTVSGLGVAVLGPIAAYNHHFIRLWVGPSADAGQAVTLIACTNIWLWSIYSLWGWIMLGTGHIRRWVLYGIISTIFNITISILGTVAFGLVGPLLGTLTGFLLVNSWALPRVLMKTFEISPWRLWQTALTPLTWGLLYTAILWLVARTHSPWGWFGLAAEMGSAALGGLALWWTLSLNEDGRNQWRHRCRSIIAFYRSDSDG